MFVMGVVLMLGGIVANTARLYLTMEWKTKWVRMIGKVHRWFGRGVIIGSQVAVVTGLIKYYDYHEKSTVGKGLAIASTVLFFLVLLIGELRYWEQNRKKKAFDSHRKTMLRDEFD